MMLMNEKRTERRHKPLIALAMQLSKCNKNKFLVPQHAERNRLSMRIVLIIRFPGPGEIMLSV